MKIGYGLLTTQRHPDSDAPPRELVAQAIFLAGRADELGLHSVWTAEHHLANDGYLPSQLILQAAIAAKTQRIQLGTGVLLAPLHHPVRLAEDAAVLDLVSGGRLTLGLGLGWRESEFAAFGVEAKNRGDSLSERVAVLRRAWQFPSPNDVIEAGDPILITPKPAQRGGIPIWIGGSAPRALRRAGRIGDGYLATTLGPEAFRIVRAQVLHETPEGSIRRSRFRFGLHWMVYASLGRDPWREIREVAWYRVWKYRDLAGPASVAPQKAPIPSRADYASTRRRVIVGHPHEVADELATFSHVMSPDDVFIAGSYFPGLPLDRQVEALEVLASEVIPRVRSLIPHSATV